MCSLAKISQSNFPTSLLWFQFAGDKPRSGYRDSLFSSCWDEVISEATEEQRRRPTAQ